MFSYKLLVYFFIFYTLPNLIHHSTLELNYDVIPNSIF